jgi:hypothetical protein
MEYVKLYALKNVRYVIQRFQIYVLNVQEIELNHLISNAYAHKAILKLT